MDAEKIALDLALYAESLGLSKYAFDEDVLEAACAAVMSQVNSTDDEDEQECLIAYAEHDGADINGGGFESQFKYLLAGCSDLSAGEAGLRAQITARAATALGTA